VMRLKRGLLTSQQKEGSGGSHDSAAPTRHLRKEAAAGRPQQQRHVWVSVCVCARACGAGE
jgi:hypothetical protein